ncbi:hypothetical protein K435DRAFT_902957 [Dendrothele bispora CBS 962.96]|uniref:NB-ARC domain-containing protein n=1 Tax=Dendrothele bispora (strain CBS 962.96) TaxID=1314807 RepID=A0A4S8LVR5_DENBC|nr:hypothetical protein K435DRAFT_902957 [Dendrothele bispora CBS 962.96]
MINQELHMTIPTMLYGRDDLVKEAVNYIIENEQALLAILGPGGIGKTALTLKIKEEECLRIPGQEGKGPREIIFGYFQTNTKYTLLILDNFETTWNSKEGRIHIQWFLEKLVKFKHISFIVTMRGRDIPKNIKWKEFGTESGIPPLPIAAARQMFLEIAGDKFSQSQSLEKVDELLQELDCVPLAVKLMAQRAKIPIESLLKMWRNSGTSVLVEGKGIPSQWTSVECSIQISVNLLDKDALKLLSVISYLPNGIPMWFNNMDQMLPNLNFEALVIELLDCSLLSNSEGNIKMLAPTREFIQSKYPIGIDEVMSLENFYLDWLKDIIAGGEREIQEEIQKHIMNIVKILNSHSVSASFTSKHIEAVNILFEMTKFYPLVIEVINNILRNGPKLSIYERNELVLKKIDMLMWNASWKEAESEIQKVREKIVENENNDARPWQRFAKIKDLQEENSRVANMVSEAQNQFEENEDQWRAIQCLQRLGDIHRKQDRYSEATDMLSNAQSQFEKIGDQLGVAQCLQSLGDIHKLEVLISGTYLRNLAV